MSYSKYHNVKTNRDGITFDSRLELRRYDELCLLIRAGEIRHLRVHVLFPLLVNGIKVCAYEADFVYTDKNGAQVVEDTKSDATKTPVYSIKKKLMKAVLGIDIVEVMA